MSSFWKSRDERYRIVNLSNGFVLASEPTFEMAVKFMHKIPRRKTIDLAIIDSETYVILKVKSHK